MGNVRQGGGIISTRLWVNNNKPHLIILTETRIAERNFEGKGIFRGYYLAQHSSSGQNSKGIIIFARAQVIKEADYDIESEMGYYTIGVYCVEGKKVIIVGMYGPPESSDRIAYEIYEEMLERLDEVRERTGVNEIIIAGDLNIHLDIEGQNPKGRTCKLLKEYMEERQLTDLGKVRKLRTWRRPGRRSKKSRIDYVLTSEKLKYGHFRIVWTKYDHAMLVYENASSHNNCFFGKDWVLASKEFIERGRKVIEDTLLDHSKEYRLGNKEGREQYVNRRLPKEYEMELDLVDKEEGIYHSHILTVIVSKIEHLQKKHTNTKE